MISSVSQSHGVTFAGLTAKPSTKDSAPADQTAATVPTQAGDGVSAYDFTKMTSSKMQDVAQNLFESGKIDLTQLFMLQNVGVPLGKAGPNGELIQLSSAERASFGNTPVNYIQTTKDVMSMLEQTGNASKPESGYEQWKGILATLQNLQGTTSGVNAAV